MIYYAFNPHITYDIIVPRGEVLNGDFLVGYLAEKTGKLYK